MTFRRLLGLIGPLAIAVLLVACGGDNDQKSETIDATTTTTLKPGVDAGAPFLDPDEPLEVDHHDPEAVAAAWGCAYWAHPHGETAEGLAERLSPLSTPAVTQALSGLRLSGMENVTVESSPGAVVPTGAANTWTVRCSTRTESTRVVTPAAAVLEVRVAGQADGTWLVEFARHPSSGLTIP